MRGMTLKEELEGVRAALYVQHFCSAVISCDLPEVRQGIAELLKVVLTNSPHPKTKIVDLADLIPDRSISQDAQLEVWKQTIRDAPTRDYLLILDSTDIMGRWSNATRHKAWKFLSRIRPRPPARERSNAKVHPRPCHIRRA